MNSRMDELWHRIGALQLELEHELAETRKRWAYRIEAGRVRFEHDVHVAHKRFRQTVPAYLRDSHPLNLLAAPVIYSMIIPIVALDLWVSLYQRLCFPLFRIARVTRRDYIVVDRNKLAYLNAIEKLNCMYCGYANGVFAYVREITGRTEQYWCPIRHARRVRGPHAHYHEFVEYGDAEGYKKRLSVLRNQLRK